MYVYQPKLTIVGPSSITVAMARNDASFLDQAGQRAQRDGILEFARRDPKPKEASEVLRVVDAGDDLLLKWRLQLRCAVVDDNRFHSIVAVTCENVRPEFVLPQCSPALGCADVKDIAAGRFANIGYSGNVRKKSLHDYQFILNILESQPLLSTTQSSDRAVFTVTSTCWAGSPTRRPIEDQLPSMPYL